MDEWITESRVVLGAVAAAGDILHVVYIKYYVSTTSAGCPGWDGIRAVDRCGGLLYVQSGMGWDGMGWEMGWMGGIAREESS